MTRIYRDGYHLFRLTTASFNHERTGAAENVRDPKD